MCCLAQSTTGRIALEPLPRSVQSAPPTTAPQSTSLREARRSVWPTPRRSVRIRAARGWSGAVHRRRTGGSRLRALVAGPSSRSRTRRSASVTRGSHPRRTAFGPAAPEGSSRPAATTARGHRHRGRCALARRRPRRRRRCQRIELGSRRVPRTRPRWRHTRGVGRRPPVLMRSGRPFDLDKRQDAILVNQYVVDPADVSGVAWNGILGARSSASAAGFRDQSTRPRAIPGWRSRRAWKTSSLSNRCSRAELDEPAVVTPERKDAARSVGCHDMGA